MVVYFPGADGLSALLAGLYHVRGRSIEVLTLTIWAAQPEPAGVQIWSGVVTPDITRQHFVTSQNHPRLSQHLTITTADNHVT